MVYPDPEAETAAGSAFRFGGGYGPLFGCDLAIAAEDAQFGLSDLRGFFTWVIGTVAAAVIFYFVVKFVRARQGVDLNRVYAEIPPE